MVSVNETAPASDRTDRVVARLRHKQLTLARSGRVQASAVYAQRALRLQQVYGEKKG